MPYTETLSSGMELSKVTTSYAYDPIRKRIWFAKSYIISTTYYNVVSCYDLGTASMVFTDVPLPAAATAWVQDMVIGPDSKCYIQNYGTIRQLDADTGAQLNYFDYPVSILFSMAIHGTKLYVIIPEGVTYPGPAVVEEWDTTSWTITGAAYLHADHHWDNYTGAFYTFAFDASGTLWVAGIASTNPVTAWYLTRINVLGGQTVGIYTDCSYYDFDTPAQPWGPAGAMWNDTANNCLWMITLYNESDASSWLLKWDLGSNAFVSETKLSTLTINLSSGNWYLARTSNHWSRNGLDSDGNICVPAHLASTDVINRAWDDGAYIINPSTASVVTTYNFMLHGALSTFDYDSAMDMTYFPQAKEILAYDFLNSKMYYGVGGGTKKRRMIFINT